MQRSGDQPAQGTDTDLAAMNWKAYVPALGWLATYDRDQLQGDVAAGLTVGVMLIPQGLAYAMIAGLPPVYGLYASIVPLMIYAFLGTSRQLAVGPTALVSLLTAAGVSTIAAGGTETYIAAAILLAFLVGVIQFLLGVFRLGFLVNFISHPVISGFTSAAAIIIGFSQLKHLLGIELGRSQHLHEVVLEAVGRVGETHGATLLVGILGILIIAWLRRINRSIPSQLVVVILGVAAVALLQLEDRGVAIVGNIPEGLPFLASPPLSWAMIRSLLPIALAISLMSFMESIAVAKAVQARHRDYQVVPDQELRALGLANLFGSFFQSFPTTGGFARTAVNDQAGARTGMASLISAALVVLTLLFLTPLFYHLPRAILASIIMVAVFGLIDFREPRFLWKSHRPDFWMLVITFVATLGLGIELGIGIGVVLSLGMVIFQSTRPHMAELGQVPESNFYRNISRFENLVVRPEILIVRFDAQLYFANINYFKDSIERLIEQRPVPPQAILVDFESISKVDSSAIHMIEELRKSLAERGMQLYFAGVKGPVRDVFARSGLTKKMDDQHFFMGKHTAVTYLEQLPHQREASRPYRPFVLQSNQPGGEKK